MSKSKEKLSKVERSARNMVGDGKLPNKYFVSVSSDYMYQHNDKDGVSCLDWVGDILKDFQSKSATIATFKTYAEAKNYCYELLCLGFKMEDFTVNTITIEDRISGQVYEKTKVLYPDTAEIEEWIHEDIGFTRERVPNFR